jgi:hypothetical protein
VLDLEPERLGQVRRAAHQAGADVAFDGGLARKAGHAHSLSPAYFSRADWIWPGNAHLQPGNFTEQERAFAEVQLAPAKVIQMERRQG